ncbi:hypothetical protein ACFPFX_15245 [Streptomyces mauvecolor]|uniref:Uncharacterized protein n=1 Tax=Streptomyces mauvecolor TaxID=58345 RepID=A0ABV9UKL0_9ACTN
MRGEPEHAPPPRLVPLVRDEVRADEETVLASEERFWIPGSGDHRRGGAQRIRFRLGGP